jgi:hypothetical protein
MELILTERLGSIHVDWGLHGIRTAPVVVADSSQEGAERAQSTILDRSHVGLTR